MRYKELNKVLAIRSASMSKTIWLVLIACAVIAVLLFTKVAEVPQQTTLTGNAAPIVAQKQPEPEFQNWHEFTPPNGKFKVLLPTLPQHANEKLEDPKTKEPRQYEMYVSEKDNGTIFMISMITMLDNKNAQINEDILKKVINDLLATNPDSKVKKMDMGSYREHPAMDFSIENGPVNIDGKAFIMGNTLFLLTSAAKHENYQHQEFDFFINSFQLNESNGQNKKSENHVNEPSAPQEGK